MKKKNPYPVSGSDYWGTDYTKVRFHKSITMKDYPFKRMNAGDEPDPAIKRYVCMVGNCSGVGIDKKPKAKNETEE